MLKINIDGKKYEARITGRKSMLVAQYQDDGVERAQTAIKAGKTMTVLDAFERQCEMVVRLFDDQFTIDELYDGFDADKNGGKHLARFGLELIESLSLVAAPKQ